VCKSHNSSMRPSRYVAALLMHLTCCCNNYSISVWDTSTQVLSCSSKQYFSEGSAE
jgi:hypothetical protein